MAKSHRATLIRICTEIAEDPASTPKQRLQAIAYYLALKGKQGREVVSQVDPDLARLLGLAKLDTESTDKPAVNRA